MRLTLALLVLLSLPASASASTVSVVSPTAARVTSPARSTAARRRADHDLRGRAGGGHRLSVSWAGDEFAVRDDGAELTAEAPCTAVDAHSARCPVTEGSYGLHGFGALLGDGDDTLGISGDMRVETELSGGDGKDVIEGSEGDDAIDGGPGDDRLLGRGGYDELSYATRTAPVTADLGSETGGEAGEDDGVGGFEVLVDGRGADVLRGAAGDEVIDGGTAATCWPAAAATTRCSAASAPTGCRAAPATTGCTATRPRATTTTRRSSACLEIASTAAPATTCSRTPAGATTTSAARAPTCWRAEPGRTGCPAARDRIACSRAAAGRTRPLRLRARPSPHRPARHAQLLRAPLAGAQYVWVARSRVVVVDPDPVDQAVEDPDRGPGRRDDPTLAGGQRAALVADQELGAAGRRVAAGERRAAARELGERGLERRELALAQHLLLEAPAGAAVPLLEPRRAVAADRDRVERRSASPWRWQKISVGAFFLADARQVRGAGDGPDPLA